MVPDKAAGFSTLIIRGAQKKEEEIYICVAKNAVGEDSRPFQVEVIGNCDAFHSRKNIFFLFSIDIKCHGRGESELRAGSTPPPPPAPARGTMEGDTGQKCNWIVLRTALYRTTR